MNVEIRRCFIPVIILMLFSSWGLYLTNLTDSGNIGLPAKVASLEDRSGAMTIDRIAERDTVGDFKAIHHGYMTSGNSRSVWWLRVEGGFGVMEPQDYVVAVNNPSLQYVTAFFPTGGEGGYAVQKAGWGYDGDVSSVAAHQIPVFEIPGALDKSRPIYLRLQSVYPHNYDIQIQIENRYHRYLQQDLILVGTLLGIFMTMALLSGVIYFFFREKTYLYYALYQLSMFLFQGAAMGAGNVFAGSAGQALSIHLGLFSCLMMLMSLLFAKAFINTRKNAPKHHVAFNVLLSLILVNGMLTLTGLRVEAIAATDFLGILTAMLTLSVAVLGVRGGIPQAKYFLCAWLLLICGGVVFILRNAGYLPNNIAVQHFLLIAAVGEALLIFAALVDRAKALWKDKVLGVQRLQEAETSQKNAEIAFLKAQIKPHFLYNTLSVIAAMTTKDPMGAKTLLYHLSDYLRGSCQLENNRGMTTLAEELNTVRAYLEIEKARFRGKLRVEYDVDESFDIPMPLLSIQPLVENALCHGIFKKAGGGCVRIAVERHEGSAVIQVQDDGVGISADKLDGILDRKHGKTGVALWNIHERLKWHYGQGLEIGGCEGGGTSVTFRVPLEEGA